MPPIRFLAIAAVFAAVFASPALAQYPDRPIRLIVPYLAGSAPDQVARTFAEQMSNDLRQPFVIENRPGAGGNVGTAAYARMAADGYTIGLGTAISHGSNPFLYRNVGYDPIRDFTPISILTAVQQVLIVAPNHPARDLRAFVEDVRRQPGRINYASGGNGSAAHLATEAFRKMAALDVVHVPYRGAPEILTAVMGGQVGFGFPTLPTAAPLIQAGRLRALAVSSATRSPVLPDVPTTREAFPPGIDLDSWFGLFGPAGLPQPVVDRLFRAVRATIADEGFRRKLAEQGNELRQSESPAQFAAFVRAELSKWEQIVKDSGAQLD